ncbi:MAG: hypothetical protein WCW44_03795 [archaeon]|jgi:hypothetical protein
MEGKVTILGVKYLQSGLTQSGENGVKVFEKISITCNLAWAPIEALKGIGTNKITSAFNEIKKCNPDDTDIIVNIQQRYSLAEIKKILKLKQTKEENLPNFHFNPT